MTTLLSRAFLLVVALGFFQTTKALVCDTHCTNCGARTCLDCAAGYTPSTTTLGTCDRSCDHDPQCVACSGQTTCIYCHAEHGKDTDGVCLSCTDTNCFDCEDDNQDCDVCKDGFLMIGPANANTCRACGTANCKTCDVNDVCTECVDGIFGPDAQTKQCNIQCTDTGCATCTGTVASQTCTSCSPGYFFVQAQASCDPCDDANCIQCDAGTDQCTDCTGSMVLNTQNECTHACDAEHCELCTTSADTCDRCETGYALPDCACDDANCDTCTPDSATCTACANPYSPNENAQCSLDCDNPNCILCATAANTCDQCAAGFALPACTATVESDPHFVMKIKGLDLPACFDLTGDEGDMFRLIAGKGIEVRGQLRGDNYFSIIVINFLGKIMRFTPKAITVDNRMVGDWNASAIVIDGNKVNWLIPLDTERIKINVGWMKMMVTRVAPKDTLPFMNFFIEEMDQNAPKLGGIMGSIITTEFAAFPTLPTNKEQIVLVAEDRSATATKQLKFGKECWFVGEQGHGLYAGERSDYLENPGIPDRQL